MPIIDLAENEHTADGVLNKFTTKRDGQDEDAFVFEADVAFIIDSVDDAKILSKMIPGAVEIFERANREDDNWKYTATAKPDIDGVKVQLSSAKGRTASIEGTVMIKALIIRASKAATTATIRFTFGGQSAKVAQRLTSLLGKATRVTTDFSQQVLQFPKVVSESGMQRGDLVVANSDGVWVVGMVDEILESTIKVKDFSNAYTVDPEEIVSVLHLDGDVTALRRTYANRCKSDEMTPTWEAIILAMGEDSEDILKGGGKVRFTPEHVNRAVARLASGDAEILPPEAGEAGEAVEG